MTLESDLEAIMTAAEPADFATGVSDYLAPDVSSAELEAADEAVHQAKKVAAAAQAIAREAAAKAKAQAKEYQAALKAEAAKASATLRGSGKDRHKDNGKGNRLAIRGRDKAIKAAAKAKAKAKAAHDNRQEEEEEEPKQKEEKAEQTPKAGRGGQKVTWAKGVLGATAKKALKGILKKKGAKGTSPTKKSDEKSKPKDRKPEDGSKEGSKEKIKSRPAAATKNAKGEEEEEAATETPAPRGLTSAEKAQRRECEKRKRAAAMSTSPQPSKSSRPATTPKSILKKPASEENSLSEIDDVFASDSEDEQKLQKQLNKALAETDSKKWNDNQRRAALMRFLRSRRPNPSGRKPRAPKIPDEMKAILEKDPKKVPMVFDMWTGCMEDWAKTSIFHKKSIKNSKTKEVGVCWKTEGQLMKIYNDKSVVSGIKASREPHQIRPHPEAPEIKSATQYQVTIFDGQVDKEEEITETGLAAQGTVEDKEFATKFHDSLSLAGNFAKDAPKPKLTQEEKVKLKAERQRKAAEKQKLLDSKPDEQAKIWLANMNKDLSKLHLAVEETKTLKDKVVSRSYKEKFESHISELKKFRNRMEKANKDPISKREIKQAQTQIAEVKDDLSAWNRIKPIYQK